MYISAKCTVYTVTSCLNLQLYKWGYLPPLCSNKGLKDTVVYRTCLSVHGMPLEITLTVPLKYRIFKTFWGWGILMVLDCTIQCILWTLNFFYQVHRRFEYKYSFKPPYLAQKDGSVPFFEYSGNAIASEESVRITPSLRCHIFILNMENWIFFLEFMISLKYGNNWYSLCNVSSFTINVQNMETADTAHAMSVGLQ